MPQLRIRLQLGAQATRPLSALRSSRFAPPHPKLQRGQKHSLSICPSRFTRRFSIICLVSGSRPSQPKERAKHRRSVGTKPSVTLVARHSRTCRSSRGSGHHLCRAASTDIVSLVAANILQLSINSSQSKSKGRPMGWPIAQSGSRHTRISPAMFVTLNSGCPSGVSEPVDAFLGSFQDVVRMRTISKTLSGRYGVRRTRFPATTSTTTAPQRTPRSRKCSSMSRSSSQQPEFSRWKGAIARILR